MGNSYGNGPVQTEPSFVDDFYFRIPDNSENEKRKVFDEKLKTTLKPKNLAEFHKTTRILEVVMFFCLYKLKERSFDYSILFEELKKDHDQLEKKIAPYSSLFGDKILKNFIEIESIGLSEKTMETKNEGKYCYKLKLELPFEIGKKQKTEEKTKKNGTEKKKPGTSGQQFNEYYNIGQYNEGTLINTSDTETSKDESCSIKEPIESKKNDHSKRNPNSESPSIKHPKFEDFLDDIMAELNDDKPIVQPKKSPTEIKAQKLEDKTSEKEFEDLLKETTKNETESKEFQNKLQEFENKIKKKEIEREKIVQQMETDYENQCKESEERIKNEEKRFRESEEERQRIHDEKMRKLREEREEFERETERLRQEILKEFHLMVSAFLKCVELKLNWDEEENKWTQWLKSLRSLVSTTKIRCSKFEDTIRLCENIEEDFDFIREELESLHISIFSNYETLYDAYFKIKNLTEQHPDRIFLFILKKQLSKVCNMFSSVLFITEKQNISKELLEFLHESFKTIDSSDIFYTSQLKNLSKSADFEELKNVNDPLKYKLKNHVKVEEMSDENDSTDETTSSEENSDVLNNNDENGKPLEESENDQLNEGGTEQANQNYVNQNVENEMDNQSGDSADKAFIDSRGHDCQLEHSTM